MKCLFGGESRPASVTSKGRRALVAAAVALFVTIANADEPVVKAANSRYCSIHGADFELFRLRAMLSREG
ncbi:hypothetical protein OKW32_003598 [Paraburkholderia youngii]